MPEKEQKKKTVQEFAEELGLSPQALKGLFRSLGYKIRTNKSRVTKEMEGKVKKKLREEKKKEEANIRRKKEILGLDKRTEDKKKEFKKKKKMEEKRIEEKLKETLRKIQRGSRAKKKTKQEERVKEREGTDRKSIRIYGPMTVAELSKMLGVGAGSVIQKCIELGHFVSMNQVIEPDTVSIVAEEFGYDTELIEETEEEKGLEYTDKGKLTTRPSIVTVMGHVDHGKTTLLDYIRKTRVTESEYGKITQHIGAYQVKYQDEKITFIDTPGHETFTVLRARGALVTDIVVLVVAANEGVKDQTIEAINHAKSAKVPIIVAINKIDLSQANPERVKKQLSEVNLVPEEWGGDTLCVETSACNGTGVDDLLEAILIKAHELQLKASLSVLGKGVILESTIDRGKGPVATCLVQEGIFKVGSSFIAGTTYGKIRAMYNEWGKNIETALPATPVLIQGFDELPQAGDILVCADSEREARRKADEKKRIKKTQIARGELHRTLTDIQEKIRKGELTELPIVIKADCQGSSDALSDTLSKLEFEKVRTLIIHKGVGIVTESDVLLASSARGIIVAFNTSIDPDARQIAKSEGVTIKEYRVIYEVVDDVQNILKGLLEPAFEEEKLGRAEVRQVFRISRVGRIAGCYVTDGKVERNSKVRVIRNGEVIFDGSMESLKRFQEDVPEVRQGLECGIKIKEFDDVQEGDQIEFFILKEVEKVLK